MNSPVEYDAQGLRKERRDLHAQCIRLNIEQTKIMQGLVGNKDGKHPAPAATSEKRGEALKRSVTVQAEFLQRARELRKLGQQLES